MEKITLKNLLMWDKEERAKAAKKLCEDFSRYFDFDSTAALEEVSWLFPFRRVFETEIALDETSFKLREDFMKAFTDRRGLDPDDCESLAPWLHPREWDGTLEGETVKEMAENYAVKNWHNFSWLLEVEEEEE